MTQQAIGAQAFSIDEEQIAEAQPRVRALQIQRYEQLWDVVAGRLQEEERGERPLDPRILEIGIRVLKEEAALYRLNRPLVLESEEEDLNHGMDPRAVVLAQLEELETKLRERDASPMPPASPVSEPLAA